MNLDDILIQAPVIKSEKWQLGSLITGDIRENSIVLIFCSEYRGLKNGDAEILDYKTVRRELYRLSKLDFKLPICDLGDLISGRSHEDTHYILQEVLSVCHRAHAIPVVVGGGVDLAFSMFSALNILHENIGFTQISNIISLSNDSEGINEGNFLAKILSSKEFSLKNYNHLGYQKHLNETDSVKLLKEVDFEVRRLADMMNSTEATEPFIRQADLVTVNCDAIESMGDGFSANPQVNGLNKREICAYMKEIGLSENLKSIGIFNFNADSGLLLNHQLLAQMIWHLIEGINIQKSHPTERQYETFWVLIDDNKYAFQRDTFTGLWYYGESENPEEWIPCSPQEYENAKRGHLDKRFLQA